MTSCVNGTCTFDGLFGLGFPLTNQSNFISALWQSATNGLLTPPLFTLVIGNSGTNLGYLTLGAIDTAHCSAVNSWSPVPASLYP